MTASKLSSKGSAITLIEYWSGIFEYIIESILATLIPDPESAVLELESWYVEKPSPVPEPLYKISTVKDVEGKDVL